MAAKILFLAGSARKDSVNKKLAKAAYAIAVEQGADATFIDLNDYPMPLYNGDYEAENGLPETTIQLKNIMHEHHGIFIASPEYNSSMSPLLVNTLDWASRSHEDNELPLSAYKGKVVAIAAASPGGLGGMRGLVPLRMMLGNIGMHVIPDQLALSGAMKAFDEDGTLNNEQQKGVLTAIITQLIKVTDKLQ